MKVKSDSLSFSTGGFNDMKDLTGDVSQKLSDQGLKNGIVTLFVPGSTGGLTTIEYESGLVKDFSELMEKVIPSSVGPSLTVPFSNGTLNLGTWQQIVFVDFDNRSRSRTILLQFLGE